MCVKKKKKKLNCVVCSSGLSSKLHSVSLPETFIFVSDESYAVLRTHLVVVLLLFFRNKHTL